jgi:hypothetical protein
MRSFFSSSSNQIGVRVASVEGTYIARRWQTDCVLQRVIVRCIYCKTVKIVCVVLIVLSEMKGRVERVRNTMRYFLHKTVVK